MKLKKQTKSDENEVAKAVAAFNAAMDEIDTVLISRSTETRSAKLCLLTRENMLIEGQHGLAKSMFAREVFSRVTDGFKTFSKQLTSGTDPDEVLGCMNTLKYKQQAIWERNVTDMLPDCHGAFIDEVYRAAKSFFSSMMQILNERTFYNGPVVVKCPLMTAIGTTNFITDDPELYAFHDRWLVKNIVSPLDTSSSRLRLLEKYVLRERAKETVERKTVTLKQLRLLQRTVSEIEIPESIIHLYEELARTVGASLGSSYVISDRRLCQTLKLIQAQHLITKGPDVPLDAEALMAASHGLITVGDATHTSAFSSAFEKIVGSYLRDSAIVGTINIIVSRVKELVTKYDDNMPAKEAKETYKEARFLLKGLTTFDDRNSKPTNPTCVKMLDGAVTTLSTLVASLQPRITKIVDAEVLKELNIKQ